MLYQSNEISPNLTKLITINMGSFMKKLMIMTDDNKFIYEKGRGRFKGRSYELAGAFLK